jgi:hypothetical protein
MTTTTATWMPIGLPASSSHASAVRLLPVTPGPRGQVCPSGGTSGAPQRLHGRDAVSGAPVADFTPAAEVRPAASEQGVFLADAAVQIAIPTMTVPTITVRNEEQHSGPSVLRPPV